MIRGVPTRPSVTSMTDFSGLGRVLIAVGLLLALTGAVLVLGPRLPFLSWLGRLPGDFVVRRGPVTIFVPLLTSLALSLLLTVLLNVLFRR